MRPQQSQMGMGQGYMSQQQMQPQQMYAQPMQQPPHPQVPPLTHQMQQMQMQPAGFGYAQPQQQQMYAEAQQQGAMGQVDFLHNPLEKKMFQFLSTQSQLPQHKESGQSHSPPHRARSTSREACRSKLMRIDMFLSFPLFHYSRWDGVAGVSVELIASKHNVTVAQVDSFLARLTEEGRCYSE